MIHKLVYENESIKIMKIIVGDTINIGDTWAIGGDILEQIFGITFAVTEIQPTPPCALNPCAVASSPDSCMKSSPQVKR